MIIDGATIAAAVEAEVILQLGYMSGLAVPMLALALFATALGLFRSMMS